jgi:hypothetical protein
MDKKFSSMQLCPLRRGPNGSMESLLIINVVLTVRERQSNDYNVSKGHITPPWRSANLSCSDILVKFES